MTLPLAGLVTRGLTALTVALVLFAFAGTTVAAADSHDADDPDAMAEDTMDSVEVLDDAIEGEPDDGSEDADGTDGDDGDGDADGDVSSTQATSAEFCTPLLVTHRADGSSGDQEAVSITAQAQEFGVDGWVNVAWQAAEGAQLSALTITAMDGTITTRTSDLQSGSAVDVLELRFCGTYDGEVSVDAGPPPSEDADDTAVEGAVATDDGGSNGEGDANDDAGETNNAASTGGSSGSTGSSGSSGSGSSGASGASSTGSDSTEAADTGDDGGTTDEDAVEDAEPLGVVTVPTPDNGDDTDEPSDATDATDAAASGDATDEPETEVLGVQLTQDSSRDSGGGLATAIGLLLLALVAGGGAFLGFRRLRA